MRTTVSALSAAFILLLSGTASAATVSTAFGNSAYYSAAAGETNNVTVTASAGTTAGTKKLVFLENGATTLTAPATEQGVATPNGCAATSGTPNSVTCDNLGPSYVFAVTQLGDGNDTATGVGAFKANGLKLSLQGEAGSDTLTGGDGDDLLFPNAYGNDTAHDTLDGGAGEDSVSYFGATGAVTVNLATGVGGQTGENDSLTAIEDATGGSASDTFTGDANNNVFDGGENFNVAAGAAVADTFNGGGGGDTVLYNRRDQPIIANVTSGGGQAGENDVYSSIENLVGGEGADTLTGGPGGNYIQGNGGNDTINEADTDADIAVCGAGNDTANLDALDTTPANDCEIGGVPAGGGGGSSSSSSSGGGSSSGSAAVTPAPAAAADPAQASAPSTAPTTTPAPGPAQPPVATAAQVTAAMTAAGSALGRSAVLDTKLTGLDPGLVFVPGANADHVVDLPADGVVSLFAVTCPTDTCAVSIGQVLVLTGGGARAAKATSSKLATQKATLKGGQVKVVKLRLNKKQRAAVRKAGSASVTVTVSVTSSTGKRSTDSTRFKLKRRR